MVNLLVSAFAPFPSTLSLSVPSTTHLSDVLPLLIEKYPLLPSGLAVSLHRGVVSDALPVSALCDGDSMLSLRLSPYILGGKGGFGSQLRAAGGRMSSQKTNNNDSCRDLSGRRLSTIKEAKKLAEYLESEPERLAAKAEAQKAKLEALERRLGIEPSSSSSAAAGPSRSSGSPGAPAASPAKKSAEEPPKLAGKKHRFDDTEYLEQSRELVDGVKSAVSAALLKKKKKAKLSESDSATSSKVAPTAKAKATVPMPAPVQTEAVGA